MAVASAAAPGASPIDTCAHQNARSQDDSSGASFAAVFAGVAQPAPPPHVAPPTRPAEDATSDVGGGNDDDDASDAPAGIQSGHDAKASSAKGGGDQPTAPGTMPLTLMAALAALNPVVQGSAPLAANGAAADTADDGQPATTPARPTMEAAGQTTQPIATWSRTAPHALDGLPNLASGSDAPALGTLLESSSTDALTGSFDRLAGTRPVGTAHGLALPLDARGATVQEFVGHSNVAGLATTANTASLAAGAHVESVAAQGLAANAAKGGSSKAAGTEPPNATAEQQTTTGESRVAASPHAALETARAVVSALDAQRSGPGAGGQGDARAALLSSHMAGAPIGGDPTSAAAALSGSTATDRVLAALDARDRAAPAAMSRITLSLDTVTGDSERVQVSMRGSSVATAIDTTSVANAEQMAVRANELATALSHQGLDAEQLQVRAVPLGVNAGSSSNNSSSDFTPRYERSFAWQQGRQRSHDDRQDGRQQRGGYPK